MTFMLHWEFSDRHLPNFTSIYLSTGERRESRQRKRWEDNIREWTGLESAKSQRAVEIREKWRKLVAKSSVVP